MANDKGHYKAIKGDCDAHGTYNFNKTNESKIGLITEINFTACGKNLVADTEVSDPLNPDSKIKVVGIMNSARWDGKPTDPIIFEFRTSPKNKGTLQEALSSLTGGSNVEAKWTLYAYDDTEKKFFEHWKAESPIKFVITEGTEVYVDDIAAKDILKPKNFVVQMSLTAATDGGEQELQVAYTAANKYARQYGINVT